MKRIEKKQVCKCKNCGNESEMVVTCTLEGVALEKQKAADKARATQHVKGTATCSHCGNEADMWIDL